VNKLTKAIQQERFHHDQIAAFYTSRSKTDYIWEVPTEIFLFNKGYIKQDISIIDMGCGPCTIIKDLIPSKILQNISYTGVDISQEMLNYAKKNVPNGKFIVSDMSTVKLPNGQANIVISLGGLHHSINKIKTLNHWLKLLKAGGVIMLREPTYEAFKSGEGESPREEGIKIDELLSFVKENNLSLKSIYFFNSKAFHLFNSIMIKIGLEKWARIRILWYPVICIDTFMSTYFNFIPLNRGLAFTAIIVKP
jgi:ubiquinone/menaquinone biosynthesis C-methylase UbiE